MDSDKEKLTFEFCQKEFVPAFSRNRHLKKFYQKIMENDKNQHILCPICPEEEKLSSHNNLVKRLNQTHESNSKVVPTIISEMSPPYKLTYFDIMGLGEPLRILLSYGGLDFEDCRVPKENWPTLKSSTPYGQLPILEYNGKTAHQSLAMARYLAKQLKLTGKDDWEDLEIDAAVDTINDFRQKVGKYHYENNEETKAEYGKTLFNEIVPFYLEKLGAQAKENGGYLVGGKLTWADLVLVGLIDYMNFMAKKDLLSESPSLQKVKENVVSVPTIKEYMEKRPNNH